MRTPPFSAASKRSDGFTLIELLVVIVVIAVLVGVSLPIITKVQNMSGKVQATSDMRNIKVAVINYYTDYRQYPLTTVQSSAAGQLGDDTVFGDPVTPTYQSSVLFNALRGQNDATSMQINPSQTVYWQGPLAKNPSQPRNGIATADFNDAYNSKVFAGSLVDPWGSAYVVWIDANKDGDMSKSINWFYTDVSATTGTVQPGIPPLGIETGSLGPDRKWGTNGNNVLAGSDDVVTWN